MHVFPHSLARKPGIDFLHLRAMTGDYIVFLLWMELIVVHEKVSVCISNTLHVQLSDAYSSHFFGSPFYPASIQELDRWELVLRTPLFFKLRSMASGLDSQIPFHPMFVGST